MRHLKLINILKEHIRYKVGDNIILPAFTDTDGRKVKEEKGTVIDVEKNDMYVIKVDKKLNKYDDRIRETHVSDMKQ